MTTIFDHLPEIQKKDPAGFKEIIIAAVEYVLKELAEKPDKWEPVSRVTSMLEWIDHVAFKCWMEEMLKYLRGELKDKSSFTFLDFLFHDGIMEDQFLSDMHDMAHYFGRMKYHSDNLIFGMEIYEKVMKYEIRP
jgi:hypothetical protein